MKKNIAHLLVLSSLAFVVNLLFLYTHNPHNYFAISQTHGQIAYNVCTRGSVWLDPAVTKQIDVQQQQAHTLIDFDAIDTTQLGEPTEPFPINDTIGYGLVLALLWKLTGRYTFMLVQWLQVLLFVLTIPLVYSIALQLFASNRAAILSCIALIGFAPLIALNVQPVRDIWAYYGLVILLYGLVQYLIARRSLWCHTTASILFALCQCVRPSLFTAVITVTLFLCVIFIMQRWKQHCAEKNNVCCTLDSPSLLARQTAQNNSKQKNCCRRSVPVDSRVKLPVMLLARAIGVLISCNLLFFWMPFVTYNMVAYNRMVVGPMGQDLVEGLGEFANPWGFQLNDEWLSGYITQKYGHPYGTPAFDDAARQEFAHAYRQAPRVYWGNIGKRLIRLVLPALYLVFDSPLSAGKTIGEKLRIALSDWRLLVDLLLRHLYVRLFLLIAYAGLLLLLWRKQYLPAALLLSSIAAGFGKLPSHIEYRYLIPFYWSWALCVGYALDVVLCSFHKQVQKPDA